MDRETSAKRLIPEAEELRPAPDFWAAVTALADLPHLLSLESARPDPGRGRYSFVSADPAVWVRLPVSDASFAGQFAKLRQQLAAFPAATLPGLPPFQGGLAGVLAYDLGRTLEVLPVPRSDPFGFPAAALGIYDWVLAFDHLLGRAWLISTGFPETSPLARRQRSRERLQAIRSRLRRPDPQGDPAAGLPRSLQPLPHAHPLPGHPGVTSTFSPEGFRAAIQRGIEYIHAGDCFQVNLSQQLQYPAPCSAFELYRRTRQRSPAPFAGYLDLGDFQVVSTSPERFVHVQGGEVRTRPIKGTRPRGMTAREDADNIAALGQSSKDRAENVMIVDLLRNDLGRVCQFGSVTVPELCVVETYPYVHHLVSEVRGRLRPGLTGLDLLAAAFPGGSITGAPKVRAMQIIAELEPCARGAYCGSLGYLGFDGTLDSNILIRTFTVGHGWLQFPVGSGIVADSEPESEYAETLAKAAGMLRCLEADPPSYPGEGVVTG